MEVDNLFVLLRACTLTEKERKKERKKDILMSSKAKFGP